MIGIYKITNPKGVIYIGASKNIIKRWDTHYKYSCNIKAQKKLYNSFKKYGIGNHIFEIIEECDIDILFEREVFWIDHFSSFDKGLNCTKGGENPPVQNKPMSEDHKRKIGESNTGRKHTEETKNRIRESLTGTKQSKDSIEKRADKLRGKKSKLKNRIRPNISEKLKGKLTPISIKCKLINMDTGETTYADSIQELCRKSGVSISSILNIRKGKVVKKYINYKYEQYK